MRNRFKGSNLRIVLSGNLLEVYRYEKPLFYDFVSGATPSAATEKTEEERDENRKRSKNRSRKNISRLVHSNFGFWFDRNGKKYISKFLTLTFRDPIFDVKEANNKFTLFIKRLNYRIFQRKESLIRYLSVIEIQPTSKKIHYHIILFNLPYISRYIDIFNETWNEGYIWIEKISNEKGAARYITKYMTKEDDERLRGEKSYFCSRGLKKPFILNNEEVIQQILPLVRKKPERTYEFQNEYTGLTKYFRFDISEETELKNLIELHGRRGL